MEMKNCFICIGLLVLTGCAGLEPKHASLKVTISPVIVYPGSIVTLTVISPGPMTQVKGRLDILGSPVVTLKPNKDKTIWIWRTQIPIEAVWKSGRYGAIVEGLLEDGTKLFGKAWVEAP